MNFEFICKECGKTPPKDSEKSNANWNVTPAECPYCGGRVSMKVK
jgi:DNA-directed RNA polymerase subunit RPC12/RpoP